MLAGGAAVGGGGGGGGGWLLKASTLKDGFALLLLSNNADGLVAFVAPKRFVVAHDCLPCKDAALVIIDGLVAPYSLEFAGNELDLHSLLDDPLSSIDGFGDNTCISTAF